MNRASWILLALLAICLAWAYVGTRQLPGSAKETLETVWNVPAGDIKKIDYRSGETHVTLTVQDRKAGQGTYLWVEGEGLRNVPQPQRKRGRNQPPTQEQPEQDAFQGNVQARRFIEEVANLQAVRVLGTAKDLKLEDFGLGGDNKAYLMLERSGNAAPLRVDLGATAPGNATRYVLSSADNRIYLVRNSAFRSLANVRRFMERELLPFPIQEAQRMDIQVGDRKLTMHRLEVPPTEANRWGRNPQDKAGEPALQEVVNGLLRIKALRYMTESVDLAKATPALTVTVTKGSEPPATLRIYGERKDEVPAVSTLTERVVALNAGLVKALLERARAVAKP